MFARKEVGHERPPPLRPQLVVIPARDIPAFRRRYAPEMTFEEFIHFHISHGGAIDDATGDFLCWPLREDMEVER